ncbi:exported hypothetical protein [Mesorhizobium metallidurans STM 2683]|uniref:Uncharacterized protein n=1 Tax=Mesorhizobium metallidurans STM 2683 TaxID=1297569 RepID=M5ERK2_9HYPH|nr:exported hypothetical protein [Mesorhizobium metallidurans STM 2683]
MMTVWIRSRGRVLVLGAASLVLGGWTWPWQDIEQDSAKCQYEALQRATGDLMMPVFIDACLRAKGYSHEQSACMWAKGLNYRIDLEACLRGEGAKALPLPLPPAQ